METKASDLLILALSDGRAGNVAMALGLAERVGELTGGSVARRDLEVGPMGRALPPAVMGVVPAGFLTRQFAPSLPDLVIGAGRRVAPHVAALRKRGVRAVQVLDPQMAVSRFDLVIAPEHDGLAAPNVVTSLGSMNHVTPHRLAEARNEWESHFTSLPRPLLAVLIGGATKRTALDDAQVEVFARDLRGLTDAGAGLVITASRRTGEAQAARLREIVPAAWFWDGIGGNPYFGMLACADGLIVTDDSVNMASEAAATGKPLAIYPLLQEGGKLARFHEALIARGHAQWFDGMPTASAGPLDETGRAAEAVAALLS